MELYYFSFTGRSKKIAEWISEHLSIEAKEIKAPHLPYIPWLFLSFIPYLQIEAEFEPPSSGRVILCFPKWTFNCPPVTYFINRVDVRELHLVICYGGFDEGRYANFYRKMVMKRAEKCEYILVKRRHIDENPEAVRARILEWVDNLTNS